MKSFQAKGFIMDSKKNSEHNCILHPFMTLLWQMLK